MKGTFLPIIFLKCRYNAENFLPLGICPGPDQPKDMDSFLYPLIDELKQLHSGVTAYDGHAKERFTLKAHLVLITGDSPGISKLLHLSGHVAKHPCRACNLSSTSYLVSQKKDCNGNVVAKAHTHQYYPVVPPQNGGHAGARRSSWRAIIDRNLTRRTHDEYLKDGQASLEDPARAMNTGVKGISPLVSEIPTIRFPESAPFDVMHLVFRGLVRDLCAFLRGDFFKVKELNEHACRMDKKEWEELGKNMSKIGAPTSFGRDPGNIAKYVKSFKAEELQNLLIFYLRPLCYNRINGVVFKAIQSLVLAIALATSYEITNEEIDEIETHIERFTEWYYETFYQGKEERLPACKYTVHGLLHLATDIRNWGPASCFWQYPEV